MDYNSRWFIKIAVLLTITVSIQVLGLSYIASILFNMFLFASTLIVGGVGAALLGTLTPLIALQLGLLPTALTSLLPFIIGGNIALVALYTFLDDKDRLLGMGIGSFIRFVIFSSGVRILKELPEEIGSMMQVSQLVTSVVGGLLSFVLVVLIIKIDNDRLQILILNK